MNKLLIFSILGLLIVGIFLFVSFQDKIEYKINTCKPIIYNGDSIKEAVERYENQPCFEGYKLFLEVRE